MPFGGFRVPIAVFILSLTSCSTGSRALTMSAAAESAEGQVRVEPGKAGNKTIELEVKRMPNARDTAPDANAYVVWLERLASNQPDQGHPVVQNVGELQLKDDRSASFRVATGYPRFRILVTPERSPNEERPTSAPVLWSAPLGG